MKNIKVLNNYIKAYEKQKKAQEELEKEKELAIKYLKENESENKLNYKGYNITLCEKKTYNYSTLAKEMNEAYLKQKKLEEISGEATIKNISNYIRLY